MNWTTWAAKVALLISPGSSMMAVQLIDLHQVTNWASLVGAVR